MPPPSLRRASAHSRLARSFFTLASSACCSVWGCVWGEADERCPELPSTRTLPRDWPRANRNPGGPLLAPGCRPPQRLLPIVACPASPGPPPPWALRHQTGSSCGVYWASAAHAPPRRRHAVPAPLGAARRPGGRRPKTSAPAPASSAGTGWGSEGSRDPPLEARGSAGSGYPHCHPDLEELGLGAQLRHLERGSRVAGHRVFGFMSLSD